MVLKFSSTQTMAMQGVLDWEVIDEIAFFLTAHCDPALFDNWDHKTIAAHAYHRGKKLGMRKKPALKQFAFLVAETGLQALTAPEIEQAMTQTGVNADSVMDELMNVIAVSCPA
jgi:copper oxidase (laccase) domain-containing protein